MERRVKIVYIDRVWFDHEEKRIVGDMGFSFEDSSDTRQLATEIEEVRRSCQEWINETADPNRVGMEEFGNGRDSDYAIYELHTAEATYNDEDYDGQPITSSDRLWDVDIDSDTDEITDIFVCATMKDAAQAMDVEYDNMWINKHYVTNE